MSENALTQGQHESIDITMIHRDPMIQQRLRIQQEIVDEYAEAMTEGATFPPLTVFHDGTAYWLADGFHRVQAAQQNGTVALAADVHHGTQRDARLYAASANVTHGVRRSNLDKRRAVTTLLDDEEEWATWSDREIARHCGVSNRFVSTLRKELTVNRSQSERTYRTRHGTMATMDTTNIGKTNGHPAESEPSTRTGGDKRPSTTTSGPTIPQTPVAGDEVAPPELAPTDEQEWTDSELERRALVEAGQAVLANLHTGCQPDCLGQIPRTLCAD